MGNSPYGFKLFKTSVGMCFAYQILRGNTQVAYHLEEKYLETYCVAKRGNDEKLV